MAVGSPSRGNYPDRTAAIGAIKDLYVKFVSGANGAVPAALSILGEIISVTRTGTGAYTVQFSQSYYQAIEFAGTVTQASFSTSGACFIQQVADANEAANGTVKFQCYTQAGAAVDPTTGDIVKVHFTVQIDSITS